MRSGISISILTSVCYRFNVVSCRPAFSGCKQCKGNFKLCVGAGLNAWLSTVWNTLVNVCSCVVAGFCVSLPPKRPVVQAWRGRRMSEKSSTVQMELLIVVLSKVGNGRRRQRAMMTMARQRWDTGVEEGERGDDHGQQLDVYIASGHPAKQI